MSEKGCNVDVWDGGYKMKCGLTIPCHRHGPKLIEPIGPSVQVGPSLLIEDDPPPPRMTVGEVADKVAALAQEKLEKLERDAGFVKTFHWDSAEQTRPSVLFRPTLGRYAPEGAPLKWTATYGILFALGDTPDEAMREFDRLWNEAR